MLDGAFYIIATFNIILIRCVGSGRFAQLVGEIPEGVSVCGIADAETEFLHAAVRIAKAEGAAVVGHTSSKEKLIYSPFRPESEVEGGS